MTGHSSPGSKQSRSTRASTLPPGTGLGGTITASGAVRRASTLSLPYRTAGNTNHTTKRLFSSFNYMADPAHHTTTPAHTSVNPFPVTALPAAATLTASSSSSSVPTSSKQPLYFAPLLSHSTVAGIQPRQHSAPASSSARTVASYYESERSWLSEPYIEQTYSSLYRTVRADRGAHAWRGNSHTGDVFDRHSLSPSQLSPTHKRSHPATSIRSPKGRVQHVDAWNVADGQGALSIGGHYASDVQRMAGGVERYEESPFEASERLLSGLHPGGMRGGHRSGVCAGSGHSHANVKVGGSGLRDERRYHSRRSGDGKCYHHCTGDEASMSSA